MANIVFYDILHIQEGQQHPYTRIKQVEQTFGSSMKPAGKHPSYQVNGMFKQDSRQSAEYTYNKG
jgi:hypothetical protein